MRLASSELAVMRIKNAISADLVFQREGLSFELDTIFAGDLESHVYRRRLLLVAVTEFEDYLGIAYGEAVAEAQLECPA